MNRNYDKDRMIINNWNTPNNEDWKKYFEIVEKYGQAMGELFWEENGFGILSPESQDADVIHM